MVWVFHIPHIIIVHLHVCLPDETQGQRQGLIHPWSSPFPSPKYLAQSLAIVGTQ